MDAGDGEPLCFYGPSLITVIFNTQTIVDATLFFITGSHSRYNFKDSLTPEHSDVLEVRFVKPRIPSFFAHLLPQDEESCGMDPGLSIIKKPRRSRSSPKKETAEKRGGTQRARKKCAFFTVLILRKARIPSEPAVVQLSADVKIFHYTAHVCGLRDSRDAELVMYFIHQAFTDSQALLDSGNPDVFTTFAAGNVTRRAFLESNTKCCTIPLVLSEGDVVMTNICGRFPKSLNLRETYRSLSINYPGVLTYLTTMSKSNYLAVTLFEHPPFNPIRTLEEMGESVKEIRESRHNYLMSSKKVRSELRKHTFFIYASGRFIQSSRNNATSLLFTEHCMRLLHAVTAGSEPPIIIDDDEATTDPSVNGLLPILPAPDSDDEDEDDDISE